MRRLGRAFGWLLLLLFIGSVVARFFLLEVAEVGHQDMVPTLREGDQVGVFTQATLERGDVVVCEHPREPGRRVVARLMGLPGDVLKMSHGKLSLNGAPVGTTEGDPTTTTLRENDRTRTLSVVRETLPGGRTYLTSLDPAARNEISEVRVETGYYLLSDERTFGTDSRRYGEVHPSLCRGRAFTILLPADGTSRSMFTKVE